ncbi:PREDICTED: uncharacterized protein LOC107065455 isoform X1 [Polistes dominula]|uniref:Uncharacterized protein LOC107065455 isoform X1 n=2 Tax=Polistes dominula TaxID=743375 RepID=A0ABM1I361_POLDO|nr:PREDICTED: uncharacterized protein LOC107065455 isoform X1 [Polistes dominula]
MLCLRSTGSPSFYSGYYIDVMPSYTIKPWTLSLLTLIFITFDWTSSESGTTIGNRDGCGDRLERALDALQRDSNRRRNRLQEEGEGREPNYQEELRSAPLAMMISRIAVKFPQNARSRGSSWARVETCYFEPSSNSLKTRVTFNDLSISGTVSLLMREERRSHIPLESCKMTLRLRQAGIDIFTGTIARARGQMRIRTESSFLEPRFASLYAYGCHPNRHEKQLKRQDKWPPYYPPRDDLSVLSAEPRRLFTVSEDADLLIANESRVARTSSTPIRNLGTWRNNLWITKSVVRRRRGIKKRNTNDVTMTMTMKKDKKDHSPKDHQGSSSMEIEITPGDFVTALVNDKKLSQAKKESIMVNESTTTTMASTINLLDRSVNLLKNESVDDDCQEEKSNFKREYNFHESPTKIESRETLLLDENLYDIFIPNFNDNDDDDNVSNNDEDHGNNRSWQSKENIAREMEDIFLRGASKTLTSYIERQLHPAIKEALMISMGYTISYG